MGKRVESGVPLERKIHLGTKLAKRLSIGTLGGCWFWTGAGSDHRYGVITYERRCYSTHRLAYELWKGPVPTGMLVCHSCDNPLCCNPSHLFLGTPKDNTEDMLRKGRKVLGAGVFTKGSIRERIAAGQKHGQKLRSADVLSIRQRVDRGENRKIICAEYGISNSTISALMTGQNWGSL
jgi:hypothetical protein